MSNITKRQHRIPRMLLKRIGGDKLWYFDLENESIAKKSIAKATVKNFYYESEDFETNKAENILAENEREVSPIFDKLENGDNKLSIDEMNSLLKFTIFMSIRTGSSDSLKKNDPRDIMESFGKDMMALDKEQSIKLICDLENFNVINELTIFRKWWRNEDKRIRFGRSKYNGLIDDQYRLWPKKDKYPMIILRCLVDFNQNKIAVIKTDNLSNAYTDISMAGRREGGNLVYYAFPFSHNKTLLFINDDIIKQYPNDKFFKLSRAANRISTIGEYEIIEKYLSPTENFEFNWMRINEARLFLIFPYLNMGVDYLKKYIEYATFKSLFCKQNTDWIIPFIENDKELSEEYKKEAEMLRNMEK